MTRANFIRENRAAIDEYVIAAGGRRPSSDSERWEWVMNHEGLYRWARSEGVRV